MNEAFFALPREKRQRMINAAMEVFAENDYKRASTDDMAARAGISKGQLFYYFHNKRELYLYLFRYAVELMETLLSAAEPPQSTDFFELLERGAEMKAAILEESPAIMDFCLRAYYDKSEAAAELNQLVNKRMNASLGLYFKNVDFSKFREGIDPMYVFRMLVWMTDGYLNEKQRTGQRIAVEAVMADFRVWAAHFKRLAYKDTCQDEGGSLCT